jgi:ribosomal protein S18 acetylase RimI-like enzyme
MISNPISAGQSANIIWASLDHYDLLAHFLNQNNQVHRHLDWFGTLDWLGTQPFLIERINQSINAFLCATPQNEEVAWVRAYGVKKDIEPAHPWQRLLSVGDKYLQERQIKRLAALALHPWFKDLLIDAGFQNLQNIVVLEWQNEFPQVKIENPEIMIRNMEIDDLPMVENIDRNAFNPLWQNSLAELTKAYHQTGISTVAIKNESIVGYQISTSMTIFGHLARLAVLPAFQRQGIAFTLVYDLLKQFKNRGFWRVTVNTQSNNIPSLRLYEIFNFSRTKEEIPVFEKYL